jgi:hypothetical protein
MIYIRTTGANQAKDLLNYIKKELKAPWGFQTVLTVDSFAKRYGSTHRVISYCFETHQMNAQRPIHHQILHGDKPTMTVSEFKKAAPGLKAQLNQPFVKEQPVFLMGFEIEGCIHPAYRGDLINYVLDLYPDIGTNHLIHHDGSIRPRNRAIEIVTPPLPIDEAIERVEWLLGMLSILSDEGIFQTNHTTGLHVNFSESKSFSCPNRQARARFTHEFMKRLDIKAWARSFRRANNRYCWWDKTPESVDDIHQEKEIKQRADQASEGWIDEDRIRHWRAINTEHLNETNAKARRVEVRVAGGKDYHSRSERLNSFLLDIRRAAQEAYDAYNAAREAS